MEREPKPRLLVLDDDDMIGVLVEAIARLAGLSTQLSSDHATFFRAVDEWQPQFIFLDLTMPSMSGEDVLRGLALRRCSACIIISSGAEPQRLADAVALAQATGLTVAGSLAKPFSPAELRGLMKRP